MSALPPGWAMATIGELSMDCSQRTPQPKESFKYIDIASIDRETKRISSPQTLVGADAPSRARKEVRTGDVLVSMTRPNLNAVAMVPQELDGQIASTAFDVIRPLLIDPRWLFYLVQTKEFVDSMSGLVQGALYPAVRSKDVRSFVAPVAPLNEQRRIADKVDGLLKRVDSCRERLDRVPSLLKRFRQAILVAAVSGKLTSEWREAKGRPADFADWVQHSLADLCVPGRVITYGVIKLGDDTPGGVPCLRTSNVRWLRIETEGVKRISPNLSAEFSRTILRGGEVLVNVRGTLGGVAVADNSMAGWNVSREVAVVPVDDARVNPEFLAFWIGSDSSQRWLEKVEKGVAYTGINIEDLRGLPVSLPPLDEQEELVTRVKVLFQMADGLERSHENVVRSIRTLTASFLAKAFRGELVPQDPEDEPATELLARLVKARANVGQPLPRKGLQRRAPRAPKEASAMTKSRQDDDVKGKPYLAGHLRKLGAPSSAEELFKEADLPVADFYKQLAWEVEQGYVKDNRYTLELGHAAG